MIWLISRQDSLVQSIRALLPASYPLKHLSSLKKAETDLDQMAPVLILLDTVANLELIAACRQLCQRKLAHDLPLIAIIGKQEDRQPALAAGADDYLLLPLGPEELHRRLGTHLNPGFRSLHTVIEIVDQKQDLLSPSTLNYSLKKLAEIFGATATWLILLDPVTRNFGLAGSYNLPETLSQDEGRLSREIKACLVNFQRGTEDYFTGTVHITPSKVAETGLLTHHLSIPLTNRQGFVGLLNLSYSSSPTFFPSNQPRLLMFGQSLGRLLEIFQTQEESQLQAMQNAFVVLAARIISGRLDLNTALSSTLELTIPLLGASAGDIWLFSENNSFLELTSSLSNSFFKRKYLRRPMGEGLIGWIAAQNKPLYLPVAAKDPHFDPKMDRFSKTTHYSLLAVPLRYHDTTIGLLVIYDEHARPSANQDLVLLEGAAALTASAIVNTRLMRELQTYAEQQRILYELSQQISAGLDLKATFERTLHWLSRLTEAEIVLLWFIEEPAERVGEDLEKSDNNEYRLVANLGIDLSQQKPVIASAQSLVGWVAQHSSAVIVNNPASDPRINLALAQTLKLNLKNVVALPIVYQGHSIGVISLINKRNGSFQEVDLPLLSTATEIVGAAAGNARLHAKTVQLIEERERLHQEVTQSERLATVGRLTAVLSHEINNPMQAIQGALMLAMESLSELTEEAEELASYLTLSLNESERVVQLVGQMRQIYNPQAEMPRLLQVNDLLPEIITTARKALKRQKVTLQIEFAEDLPPIKGMANQLHLVFLSLLLNLSDRLGVSGGEIQLRTQMIPQMIQVILAATPGSTASGNLSRLLEAGPNHADLSFGLLMREEIIRAHQGRINLSYQADQIICKVELPFIGPTNNLNLPDKKNRE